MRAGTIAAIVRIRPADVMPFPADQDTAGPMARDVTSAAIMLNAMAGPDPLDTPAFMGPPACAPADYTQSLDPNGLSGARIAVPEQYYATSNAATKAAIDAAAADLTAAGATVAHAMVPSFDALSAWGICAAREQTKANDANCSVVLKYGFKRDFNAFLNSLGATAPVATLSDLRAFNTANAASGAIKYLQARLDISDEMNVQTDLSRYTSDRQKDLNLAGTTGIDATLALGSYDALLFAGARGASASRFQRLSLSRPCESLLTEALSSSSSSIGRGKTIVEFFSAAISVSVWRYRRVMLKGCAAMTLAAWASLADASSSPSA